MNPWAAYKSSIWQFIVKHQPCQLADIIKYTKKQGLPRKYVMAVIEDFATSDKINMIPNSDKIIITSTQRIFND